MVCVSFIFHGGYSRNGNLLFFALRFQLPVRPEGAYRKQKVTEHCLSMKST